MLKNFLYILILILALFAILSLIGRYLDLPMYCQSVRTNECKYIINYKGEKLSCDTFDPDQRYIHTWAE